MSMTAPLPPRAAESPSTPRARELLVQAGRALHGDEWITPLSRDLDIRWDTVRDWASGRNKRFSMAHPVWAEITRLLSERGNDMLATAAKIEIERSAHDAG